MVIFLINLKLSIFYLSYSLIKIPDDRSTCELLSENEFINKYINEPIDLNFIKRVIDEVAKEPIE